MQNEVFQNTKAIMIFILLVAGFIALSGSIDMLIAGTGGSELNSLWVDLSGMLKGTMGKLIAVFFLALCIMAFKAGSVPGGGFLLLIALSIGILPDIVDSRYTVIF